ncbi:uncharacterized protein LOC128548507 [Mercenaria mercenaria]|uniref:uncharacterized protein LOC128548507 n=1 Tax=Mercenaria mercenaria TaxID=6596 RepID=UPI00234E6A5F|nr:uncharacterized protein LOC128548507 [Mercenaria mercenaria]
MIVMRCVYAEKCIDGFYGKGCKKPCPDLCVACNRSEVCTQYGVSTDNVITEERYVTKEGSYAYESTQAGKKRQTDEVTTAEVNSSTADDGMTETDRADLSFLIVIASCVAGAVVVIVFILTLSVIIKRRRTTKLKSKHSQRKQINGNENVIIILDAHEEQKDQGMAHQICDEALDAVPIELNNERNTYYNTGIIRRKIAVTDLPMFIQNKADVLKDFQLLPPDLIKPYADSQRGDNIHRNRYRMVYPYDFNRVKLNGMENDYINASYIDASIAISLISKSSAGGSICVT